LRTCRAARDVSGIPNDALVIPRATPLSAHDQINEKADLLA
jgi:hypothetical protein